MIKRAPGRRSDLTTAQADVFSAKALAEVASQLQQLLLELGLDTSVPQTGCTGSKVRLPRISVGCGSYRTLTSDSVYFESEESTLNATTTDDV